MKNLPKYMTLCSRSEGLSDILLETIPPFLIGKVYGIPKAEPERVAAEIEAMESGRWPLAKVRGYTLFVHPAGSLTGEKVTAEELRDALRGMAEYYAREAMAKPHRMRKYQEGVPDDIDERNGEIRKAARERLRRMKEVDSR